MLDLGFRETSDSESTEVPIPQFKMSLKFALQVS